MANKELQGKITKILKEEMITIGVSVEDAKTGQMWAFDAERLAIRICKLPLLSDELRAFISRFKREPKLYHHLCYASGTVCIIDHYSEEEIFYCPHYNGDFNCGYRSCKDGKIKGLKDLTEIERHQNWLIDEIMRG